MKDSEDLYKKICAEREAAKAKGQPIKKYGYAKIKANMKLRARNPW